MTSGQAKRDPSKLPSPRASEPEAAPAKPLTGEACRIGTVPPAPLLPPLTLQRRRPSHRRHRRSASAWRCPLGTGRGGAR
jgi:hypothetical protein